MEKSVREKRKSRFLATFEMTGWGPRRLGGGARGVGVEAFFIEEEDAGAEGEEHDGEAGGDAETRDNGGGTILATADDDVAGDGD